jgi:dipeptidyl aminopeptidase/acylaminoacyl peptidase
MVMALVTEYPDMWSAACNRVGIADWVNFLKKTGFSSDLVKEEFGPVSDEEFLRSISPIHKLDLIQTPLMVYHGKNDFRVPVSEAYQIIENLESRRIPVKSLILEDEGHGIIKRKTESEFLPKLWSFLKSI